MRLGLALRAAFAIYGSVIAASGSVAAQSAQPSAPRVIGLAGEWRLLLDPEDRGLSDRVYETTLPDRITLPGYVIYGRSRSEPRRQASNAAAETHSPQTYVGPAWYQRSITVPYAWRRRRITLYLERCCWESRLWIDGKFAGIQDSLSTPHVYDITKLASPGQHRITIRVDNRAKHALGRVHAYQPAGSAPWNGILGRIELRGSARVWIEAVQVFPDARNMRLRVRTRIGNITDSVARVQVEHTAWTEAAVAPTLRFTTSGTAPPGWVWLESSMALPMSVPVWDTRRPSVYVLHSAMEATNGRLTWLSVHDTAFGVRSLSAEGGFIRVNGQPILLRGAIHRGVSPQETMRFMDARYWEQIFRTAASYGINQIRFDTWCPPNAAFEAADRLGLLLLVEAPLRAKDFGRVPDRDQFARDEAGRMLAAYGNHPSFAFLTLGSELTGDEKLADAVIRQFEASDNRRLYAVSTGGFATPRDAFAVLPLPVSHAYRAGAELASAVDNRRKPFIVHEWGRSAESVLEATGSRPSAVGKCTSEACLSIARARLALLEQATEQLLRSGVIAGYHLAGFASGLLDGVEPPGPLDREWRETGLVRPDEMRRWCADTLLLVSFSKRVLSTADMLKAEVGIAHFGVGERQNRRVVWKLLDDKDTVLGSGILDDKPERAGTVAMVGVIEFALAAIRPPARLRFRVELDGRSVQNEQSVYVYTPEDLGPFAEGVFVARRLSAGVLQRLERGESVLLLADVTTLRRSVSAALFGSGNSTLPWELAGILCDPRHPALRLFPTPAWADVQWHDMLQRSRCAVLDAGTDPRSVIVAGLTADGTVPLGLVMEHRVGTGRLLICTLDLLTEGETRHEARQLLQSLLTYASSPEFNPRVELDSMALKRLLRTEEPEDTYAPQPPDTDRAVAWIRAGGAREAPEESPWSREQDVVITLADGVQYSIEGKLMGTGATAGLTSAGGVRVQITLPIRVRGHIWLRLLPEDKGIAHVLMGRTLCETVAISGTRPFWLRIPVSYEDAGSDRIRFGVLPEVGSFRVLDIVLTVQRPGQ